MEKGKKSRAHMCKTHHGSTAASGTNTHSNGWPMSMCVRVCVCVALFGFKPSANAGRPFKLNNTVCNDVAMPVHAV